MTLTPIAERLAVELSQPVFTTKVCRGLDSKTQPSTCGAKDSAYPIIQAHIASNTT